MRFLVIASVLAFVAAEPETFHHLGAHATAGYVKHMNGAVVPEDTASVKAAKGLHMAAKHNAALNGYAMPYVYQPLVKPVAPVVKTVEVEAPKVVSYKAPEFKPITYTKPLVYTKPVVTQPLTYTAPAVHHVAAPVTTYTHPIATTYTTPYVYGAHHLIHKREAEADAESDAQMYYTNAYPTTYTTPYTYANAYTTPYTYASPMVYKTPLTTYSVPKTYTYTTPYAYTSPMVYNTPYVHHTIAKREAESDADAQYYYGNYFGAYPTTYTTPYTYSNAYTTPYTYGSPMVYNYNPYNTYGYQYVY